jgi:hypothetical protein
LRNGPRGLGEMAIELMDVVGDHHNESWIPASSTSRSRSAHRRARHKHPYSSCVRPTTAISTSSTVLKSTDLKRRQSRAPARDRNQERQLCHVDDDGSTDDLSDEDYDNYSDANSKTAEKPHPPERLRRAKTEAQLITTWKEILVPVEHLHRRAVAERTTCRT